LTLRRERGDGSTRAIVRKLAIVSAALFACTSAPDDFGSRDRTRGANPPALYTNGGFEGGNLSSWTVTTNLNQGITYPPASVADLSLRAGGNAFSFARTGATPESQIPSGMSATATLRYPKYGTWSAVVNEGGANQNVNSITQQMATTAADVDPSDSLIHVRFVVAPVLQNPGHTNTQQPYYYVLVTNVTQGTTLFARFNYVNETGVPWQSDSAGTILYTGWQVVDVPGTAGSIAIGDTVQVRVIAAGCSLGGHWGEAYVDAFGAFLPGLSIAAHAPQKVNAGSTLTTSYVVTNSGASSTTSVAVVAPVPPQTTFFSLSAPAGAVCTTPAVGATGNVSCNFGTMNPSSTLSFTVVTTVAAAATGSIPNGSYTVSSTGASALLGPLVTTAVTGAVTYADLSVTMDDGKGGVAWGQAVQYTITVSNAGPTTATNATVVDPVPAQLTGATWTCVGAGGGTCGAASGNGNINATVTLPSGASATYVLSANVVAGAGTSRVTNVVNVATAGATSDPDTTSNRAADTDDIGTVVTITVQKDATGTGLGTVVSSPVAINCGPACNSAAAQFGTGNLLTLTAIAEPGDSFAGWSGACSGVATTCNLNPAANATATAKFVPQSFAITASAPAGNGNLSCTSPVLHTQSSTCTLAPAAGYKLAQLADNGTDVTALVAANAYTISSVAADHAVVASFLKDLATACSGNAECAGGICVDGVCCNAACGGQCQACDVPGSAGTCTTVGSGGPHGTRAACGSDGSACGGTCDGSNAAACGYPGAATSCRSAACSGGAATPAASCNGTGTCPAAATTQCSPYACGATACKTTCAVDSDCISADYCNAGACVAKKADGLACAASNQCANGSCADGVCCNQACGGQCQACNVPGSVGQCVAVAGSPPGGRAACATDGSSCGGSCDGVNGVACAYPAVQCRGASCAAGTATAAASCNGAGACPAASTTACTPYACGATACKTTCAADADCVAGDYCNAGACVAKKADGLACATSNQCTNGSCADGVCCNQACGGQCQACDVPGLVGQCVAVSGTPHGGRAACASDGSFCGGSCDGVNAAACSYPAGQCRGATCAAGTATAAASCDGAGACPAPSNTACTPYACGATACKTTCAVDSDCVSGDYCGAGGACVPKKPDGVACAASNQCANASCADGVCCNQACGGQCQACDIPGSVGQCVAVTGAPRGARAACAGSGTCAGTCDGGNIASCAYPTAQCRGASCAAGVATAAASCDGAGACPASATAGCSPYLCGAIGCNSTCTTDAECAGGDFCNSSGACVPKKADGAACLASSECGNGSCADGVCCNQACNGQCEACDAPGSVGQCVAVSGTPHGARSACTGAGSSCGGACDGVQPAACAYPDPATSCRDAACSGGTATAAATCDGAGACPPPVTASCDPYACGPTACKTGCSVDADCIAQDYCDPSGQCLPRATAGQACTSAAQCGSGFCVDGLCCDQACAGQCQACDVAGSEGVCSPVIGDPRGARAACLGSGTVCGGSCDGVLTAACAYPAAAVSCRDPSCAGGTAVLAAGCDGAGSCPAQQTQSCIPYTCGATACLGNCGRDADCVAGDWCAGGVCAPRLGDGVACGAAGQCASGNCVDGVCCDQACDGQCQACDVPGSAGACVAVSGDPHGARAACSTDGSACGGSCDGAHGLSCAYPAAQCRGASCGAGVATLAASCDGAGHCPVQQTQPCAPYICGAAACRGDCVVDTDCSGGNFCAAGVCAPVLAAGAACGGANQCGSGFCVDGVCCDQACNGQCQACDVPGSAGACAAVAGAPHGARQACLSDGSFCGGVCDGSNGASCAYPATQCRGASCSSGVATLAAACDGAGRCPAVQTQACGAYVCGPTACKGNCGNDADCVAGDWCSAGVCVPLLSAGSACTVASQCGSANCVDGVCCTSACNGQCEACNVAGSAGACTAVVGDPRGGRQACATDGSSCGGVCDGSSRTSCAYPSGQCRGASCANAVATAAAACDGAGHCPAPQQLSCSAYACGPAACKTACGGDSDCADNGFCISGVCHSRNDPSAWVVAGAGCSAAGPALWPLLLIVLAFALRRRKRAAAALLVALGLPAGAHAQSATFTVDRFQPGAGALDVLGVWSADSAQHLDWHASLYTSYARDPLRLVAVGHPDEVQLLHGQSMLHFGASVGLWDRFEIGAVLPVTIAQGSEGAPMLGGPVAAPVASAGLGDLRVLPKMRLLNASGLVLGLALPFTVPTGRQDSFLGAGAPTLAPTLLAELQGVLPVRLLANAGIAVRGGRSLGNLNVSNALTYGLAAELPFTAGTQRLAALGTLAGEAGLAGGGAVERPLELLAALRWTALRGLDLTAGGGPGLSVGYGTPRYRMFFSLSFSPAMLAWQRPKPLLASVVQPAPGPRPAMAVQPAGEPVVLSRTLELARIEEDHVELFAPVLFERDRDVLLVQSRAVLDATAAVLREHPDLSLVRVEGHTDGKGNATYNLSLSQRRARAVRLYLIRHGIDAGRLQAEGFGSAQPIDSNLTVEGRARNRRVEFLIVHRNPPLTAAGPGD
jgi:uncharacterized repeat protein (TIGR01451 family)